MNHLPADLSPETAAWLQAQIVIHNARTAATLREEVRKVDEWANSIFAALRDALGHALCELPALRKPLGGDWVYDAQDFEQVCRGIKPTNDPGATGEELEARAMLYRYFVQLGLFSLPARR